MDAIADQAHRRVREIDEFKDLASPAYQHEYDDALAKYYAYNRVWNARTREGFVADLRAARDDPNDGLLRQAKDRDRAARFWRRYVDELLVHAGELPP